MKIADVKKLKKGDKINHKHYGDCIVQEIMWSFGSLFGVVIRPITEQGKALLAYHSGSDVGDLLEGSVRMINLITTQELGGEQVEK